MGSLDRVDDRTFRVNFSEDGVGKLRERVREKLKEFMGDYTDDTLVEYVIVLLRNGRRKEEAKTELNVFLGDDSDSFVSWLWDHLASSVELYVSHGQTETDKTTERRTIGAELVGNDPHHVEFESKKLNTENISKSRHRREWRDPKHEPTEQPSFRSSEVFDAVMEDTNHHTVDLEKRSASPRVSQKKKRSRQDEREQSKREKETVALATIDAPRRLLQFAVRDALGTPKASSSVKEPSLKRLRSVVSTSTEEPPPQVDRPRRIQSIARVPGGPMATVIKAVKEAAEDVTKVKTPRSVFDRLGRDSPAVETTVEYRDVAMDEEEYAFKLRRGNHRGLTSNFMAESGDDMGMDDRDLEVLPTGTSRGGSDVHRFKVQHNADDFVPNKCPDQSVQHANVSWKQPLPHQLQLAARLEQHPRDNEKHTGKVGAQIMKENSNPIVVALSNLKPATDHKEPQQTLPSTPGSLTAGRPVEDAESRTVFVSNVHFAATKDSLSRHFNKFGEVLKVVIVTDAATGQPKGSAYVEFTRKEAADNALSLSGTSFMSRILKVIKRSAATQEDSPPTMVWPLGVPRGSPYGVARFSRSPFVRGIPGGGAFRGRFKLGARSMQWKRGAQGSNADATITRSSSVNSPGPRSLTYVRTEPKQEGTSAAV
ncbi:unnamed protein product [Linum tenue]|uniref:RRM domain-containing protein n=1 Tax=Linum tenue TaxID=586396 RepID=A0AAV0L0V2_9ROSI|nr:unnamed protein product [Linum tenue]